MQEKLEKHKMQFVSYHWITEAYSIIQDNIKQVLSTKLVQKFTYWDMVGWPELGTVTPIANAPEWRIVVATTWTRPVIFPASTYKS